jgi:hypothetical protein
MPYACRVQSSIARNSVLVGSYQVPLHSSFLMCRLVLLLKGTSVSGQHGQQQANPYPVVASRDIRSRKKPFGLSLPASFTLSGGTQPPTEEGNCSVSPEKTLGYRQQSSGKVCKGSMSGLPKTFSGMLLRAGWTWSIGWTLAHLVLLQAAQW